MKKTSSDTIMLIKNWISLYDALGTPDMLPPFDYISPVIPRPKPSLISYLTFRFTLLLSCWSTLMTQSHQCRRFAEWNFLYHELRRYRELARQHRPSPSSALLMLLFGVCFVFTLDKSTDAMKVPIKTRLSREFFIASHRLVLYETSTYQIDFRRIYCCGETSCQLYNFLPGGGIPRATFQTCLQKWFSCAADPVPAATALHRSGNMSCYFDAKSLLASLKCESIVSSDLWQKMHMSTIFTFLVDKYPQ